MNLLQRLGLVAGVLLLVSGCTSATEIVESTSAATRQPVAAVEPTAAVANPPSTPVEPSVATPTATPANPAQESTTVPTPTPTVAPVPVSAAIAEQDHNGLAGTRGLTLQWVSWEPEDWGSIEFVPLIDGSYAVEGTQVGPDDDFVSVNGTIVPISDSELLFSGEVVVQVSYTNEGQPCVRSGDITFLATGDRQFWRMQDLLNCDGIVTDYVDIYFG